MRKKIIWSRTEHEMGGDYSGTNIIEIGICIVFQWRLGGWRMGQWTGERWQLFRMVWYMVWYEYMEHGHGQAEQFVCTAVAWQDVETPHAHECTSIFTCVCASTFNKFTHTHKEMASKEGGGGWSWLNLFAGNLKKFSCLASIYAFISVAHLPKVPLPFYTICISSFLFARFIRLFFIMRECLYFFLCKYTGKIQVHLKISYDVILGKK